MEKVYSILKAIKLRKNRQEIEKRINKIFDLVKEKLDEAITYNLIYTEFYNLAVLTCSCLNSSIKISDIRSEEDFIIDISEIQNSIINRLEEFITNYCKENNLKFESEGSYNSANSWLNGKKFCISLDEK